MEMVYVLLVEDDEDDYVITRDLLADIDQTSYILHWVNNTKEAFQRLQEDTPRYDVCLLDYRLGSETGIDFLRRAVAANLNVPIILLTEHTERQIDLLAMQEGASDFLVKSELTSISLDRVIRYVRSVSQHQQERLELALALEARRQAEATNKSKDDFLGMVSHELRGPINALILWVELLKNPDTDTELKATAVDMIERSILQQCKLLDDLLEFTRGINRLIRLHKQPLNIVQVLRDILQTLRPNAESKDLQLDLLTAADTYWIDGDNDRLHQIFGNLLNNSIKFTPKAGRIRVEIAPGPNDPAPTIEVKVKDTGKGISADMLPKVFKRYQQDFDSFKGNVGLGIGLTIVQQLVELHGGSIRAESPGEDQGAVFTVTLPLCAGPS